MPGGVWNILLHEGNAGLIQRLQAQFRPLREVAQINRGLVTGDKDRFISEAKKSESYVPIIEGGDVFRYYAAPPAHFVLFERPESAGGCWEPEVHLAPHKIVIRQIGEAPTASLLREPVAVTANIFTARGASLEDEMYILGIINSRLTEFFWRTMFADFKTSFPQVTAFSLEQLPVKVVEKEDKKPTALKKRVIEQVASILDLQAQRHSLPLTLRKKIRHSARTPCNLAHYLQPDFAAAVKFDKLIDDVQRASFVHGIGITADGKELTLSATVADKADGKPGALPVLRLAFKDDALRQFIYAGWKQFLADHSRQKKWTKGKKPEPVYPLLVNALEPLVYFNATAGDNLRAIRDVMKAVADEAGSADLAAIEAEIKKLDQEIDERVYELYGLTPEEKQLVEESARK